MKLCIIGASGHYSYVINDIKGKQDIEVTGIAPGSCGREFRSVFASHSSLYNQEHGELEVTALCQFTMDDEVLGSVTIDYLRPQNAPTHDDDRIRLVGTRGILEVRGGKVFLLNNETNGQQELPLLPESSLFADFMRQVRGKGNCLVSAEDSFAVTRACLKARMSADCGKVIYF